MLRQQTSSGGPLRRWTWWRQRHGRKTLPATPALSSPSVAALLLASTRIDWQASPVLSVSARRDGQASPVLSVTSTFAPMATRTTHIRARTALVATMAWRGGSSVGLRAAVLRLLISEVLEVQAEKEHEAAAGASDEQSKGDGEGAEYRIDVWRWWGCWRRKRRWQGRRR